MTDEEKQAWALVELASASLRKKAFDLSRNVMRANPEALKQMGFSSKAEGVFYAVKAALEEISKVENEFFNRFADYGD